MASRRGSRLANHSPNGHPEFIHTLNYEEINHMAPDDCDGIHIHWFTVRPNNVYGEHGEDAQ